MSNFTFAEPASKQVAYFLYVYTVIHIVCFVSSMFMLFKKRKHRIISHRSPITLMAHLSFAFAFSMVETASMIFGKTLFCMVVNVMLVAYVYFTMHFIMVTPTVVFQSQINKAKETGKISTWFMIARKSIRLPFRIILSFIVGTVNVIMYLFLLYFSDYSNVMTNDCNRVSIASFAISLMVMSVLLIYFTVKLMRISDPFFMKFEINLSMMINFPTTILLTILYAFAPHLFPEWFDYRWLYIITNLLLILLTATFPICLTNDKFYNFMTRLTSKNLMSTTDSDIGDMNIETTIFKLTHSDKNDIIQTIFNNTVLYEGFKKFNIEHWSVENVLFYQAVEKFKNSGNNINNIADFKVNAMKLYNEFIKTGCLTEINIEDIMRKKIFKAIEDCCNNNNININIFDLAQSHIVILMKSDTIVKWQATVDFNQCLKLALKRKVSKNRNSTNGDNGSDGETIPSNSMSNTGSSIDLDPSHTQHPTPQARTHTTYTSHTTPHTTHPLQLIV